MMAVHWKLALACHECGATVTWEDERTEWHEDEERVAKIAKAERWLRKHPAVTSESPEWSKSPEYVVRSWHLFTGERIYVYRPPTRYTTCLACDSRIYIDQHAMIEEPADVQEDAGEDGEAEAAS